VSFFNTQHTSGSSGVQSNLLSGSAADPNGPTVAEFKAALKDAIAEMLSFLDDQGEPLLISASGLAIAVPPPTLFAVTEAINATVIDSSSRVWCVPVAPSLWPEYPPRDGHGPAGARGLTARRSCRLFAGRFVW